MDKNKKGIECLQEGKFEEAIKFFSEAIEENPSDPVAYINFGNVLIAVNEMERAVKFFEKAIDLDDQASAAYYCLGNLYYEQEQYEQAVTYFEKAKNTGLNNNDIYFMIGMCFVQLGNPKLAMPYLQRSVELNAEDVEARFQYALVLAQSEVYEEAIQQFISVVNQDPQHADAYYNLGVAYLGYYEDSEKAAEFFNQALEIQPDHVLSGYGIKMIEKMRETNE
ncbi:tetratricopeptide repeat protein [Heyndrickxia vini]|uniref:Tetratricopeptide repeat protein n=1 Tax=Heyndrickxia vini TaxID=1476025 RepID=A0ABX7E6B7_9BACI|nr:tetratricopeptide repeat protein [Heyndrickxia vini]QQZ10766.1 tetratricopeptide repeat protein [Heyndrickxia vini]